MARMTYKQKLGAVTAILALVLLGIGIVFGGGAPMAFVLAAFGALSGFSLQQLGRRHEQRLRRP